MGECFLKLILGLYRVYRGRVCGRKCSNNGLSDFTSNRNLGLRNQLSGVDGSGCLKVGKESYGCFCWLEQKEILMIG